MQPKSSAYYQREYRNRLREQGLVKKEVWILPENTSLLAAYEKDLRQAPGGYQSHGSTITGSVSAGPAITKGEQPMTDNAIRWTTASLYQALCEAELFESKRADVELIDGASSVLHIVMGEFGDLPIFLSVSGEQIIVEAMLWSASDVKDVVRFNEAVLRTHKYFPLSTISLDSLDGEDAYHMFGALSSTSSLNNVIFEIEALASNVIQATEAYSEFLIEPLAA